MLKKKIIVKPRESRLYLIDRIFLENTIVDIGK